jgi:hypothetical protein
MDRPSEKKSTNDSNEKPAVTLPGRVEKIVPAVDPREPEQAEIHIDSAEPLYQEIRVENTLKDASGEEVKLKKGAHVEVTIEAAADATIPKTTSKTSPTKEE